MSDEIKVDAQVLELATTRPEMPEVAFTPASITADFEAMLEWAQAIKATYEAATFSDDESGYRDAKAERAAIRTYVRDIEARRKAVKADYSAPLVAFEAKVKQITGALTDAADVCDAFVKDWEDAEKARKYAQLQAHFEDFAPMLVGVLPFARFYDLMQRRGRKWANKTPGLSKCMEELEEDVERVAQDVEAVDEIATGHPDVAARTFWATLDVNEARRAAKAADDEDARIAALKAQQEELERARAERERARREAEQAERERRAEEARRIAEAFKASAAALVPEPLAPVAREAVRQAVEAAQISPYGGTLPDGTRVFLEPESPEERYTAGVRGPVPYEPPRVIDGSTGTWTIVLEGVTEAVARRLLDAACDVCGSGSASIYKGDPMRAAVAYRMNRR